MWQSLVTIGPETSEISRWKKSKRIETSAVKYRPNGRRPAGCRAAIIIHIPNGHASQDIWEMMMHNVNNNQVYRLNSSSMPSAANPSENSYKPHMLCNHSSLASFLSLTVKGGHIHSVTHIYSSESHNIRTSSMPSIKRTLSWIEHTRSFNVILIGAGTPGTGVPLEECPPWKVASRRIFTGKNLPRRLHTGKIWPPPSSPSGDILHGVKSPICTKFGTLAPLTVGLYHLQPIPIYSVREIWACAATDFRINEIHNFLAYFVNTSGHNFSPIFATFGTRIADGRVRLWQKTEVLRVHAHMQLNFRFLRYIQHFMSKNCNVHPVFSSL